MVVVTASVAEAMAEAATAWAEQMLWAREVAATVVAAMVEAVTAWAAAGCILTASMLAEATEEAERAREVVATAAAQGGRRRRGHALHVLGEGGQLDVEALARARGCDHDAVVAVLLGAHVLRLRVVQWPESRREAAHEPVMEAAHVFLLGRRARRA